MMIFINIIDIIMSESGQHILLCILLKKKKKKKKESPTWNWYYPFYKFYKPFM